VVRDGFAVVDAEAAPSCSFGGFETCEEVEEGKRGAGGFGIGEVEFGEDWVEVLVVGCRI
jgi:hypothetical protein